MAFLIGLLTLVMVVDCLILILLVLIQLPKKDAGAALAFGGGATDALFGAGSGTVLTKITKYAATAFFIMAVILSILQSNYHRRRTSAFETNLNAPGAVPNPVGMPRNVAGSNATRSTPTAPGVVPPAAPAVESTNTPAPAPATAPAATNPAAAPK